MSHQEEANVCRAWARLSTTVRKASTCWEPATSPANSSNSTFLTKLVMASANVQAAP